MMEDPREHYPRELALEQLVLAIVFEQEARQPGYIDRVQREGAGAARISVAVDIAFMDLMQTIRIKARRAGLIE